VGETVKTDGGTIKGGKIECAHVVVILFKAMVRAVSPWLPRFSRQQACFQ